jgi:hypothetical protein
MAIQKAEDMNVGAGLPWPFTGGFNLVLPTLSFH